MPAALYFCGFDNCGFAFQTWDKYSELTAYVIADVRNYQVMCFYPRSGSFSALARHARQLSSKTPENGEIRRSSASWNSIDSHATDTRRVCLAVWRIN